MEEIIFVTGNENKYKELSSIFKNVGVIKRKNIDLEEIQGSFLDIAIKKAQKAYKIIQKPLIIEDTSLSFNALNGMPGPYIKDFHFANGSKTLYKMIENFEDKTAVARCIIVYQFGPDENFITFIGETEGMIVNPRSSDEECFGWDDIFEVGIENQDKLIARKTFAEMTMNEKNSISHRRKAINLLKTYIMKCNK